MRKEGDLRDFECWMIVVVRQAALNIVGTDYLLGFPHTGEDYKEWPEKEKIASEQCNDQTGSSWQGRQQKLKWQFFKFIVWNKASLNAQNIISWSRQATGAEDRIGCCFCQLWTGNWGYNLHKTFPKSCNRRWKMQSGLINLCFCSNIHMVGSEFSIKNMQA